MERKLTSLHLAHTTPPTDILFWRKQEITEAESPEVALEFYFQNKLESIPDLDLVITSTTTLSIQYSTQTGSNNFTASVNAPEATRERQKEINSILLEEMDAIKSSGGDLLRLL